MGMFTTILDPEKNLSVQIKCGEDQCDVFSVGDVVPWHIVENWPTLGYLFDDVYLGIGGTPEQDEDHSWDDYWVVIKNHVVLAVLPYQEDDSYPELRGRYQIQDPPKDLWSEEAWEKHRTLKAKVDEEAQAFEKSIAHLPPRDRLIQSVMRPFRRRLDYASIGRSIFQIQPMPPGALLIYDKDPDATPELDPDEYEE